MSHMNTTKRPIVLNTQHTGNSPKIPLPSADLRHSHSPPPTPSCFSSPPSDFHPVANHVRIAHERTPRTPAEACLGKPKTNRHFLATRIDSAKAIQPCAATCSVQTSLLHSRPQPRQPRRAPTRPGTEHLDRLLFPAAHTGCQKHRQGLRDFYSTVTLFARFRGLSTSQPLATAI